LNMDNWMTSFEFAMRCLHGRVCCLPGPGYQRVFCFIYDAVPMCHTNQMCRFSKN